MPHHGRSWLLQQEGSSSRDDEQEQENCPQVFWLVGNLKPWAWRCMHIETIPHIRVHQQQYQHQHQQQLQQQKARGSKAG